MAPHELSPGLAVYEVLGGKEGEVIGRQECGWFVRFVDGSTAVHRAEDLDHACFRYKWLLHRFLGYR